MSQKLGGAFPSHSKTTPLVSALKLSYLGVSGAWKGKNVPLKGMILELHQPIENQKPKLILDLDLRQHGF